MGPLLRENPEMLTSTEQQPTVVEEVVSDTHEVRSAELEMSLNAHTKLVKVPASRDDLPPQAQAQEMERLPTAQRDEILLATWNENSVEKAWPS